ncbi:hypothetical protein DFJ74DRAFT_219476 [Hyaloraphidium curvatum]|nr:hypothetical protein DFJ74DRAFT_219476 [Hyaloraphidium curvatum]
MEWKYSNPVVHLVFHSAAYQGEPSIGSTTCCRVRKRFSLAPHVGRQPNWRSWQFCSSQLMRRFPASMQMPVKGSQVLPGTWEWALQFNMAQSRACLAERRHALDLQVVDAHFNGTNHCLALLQFQKGRVKAVHHTGSHCQAVIIRSLTAEVAFEHIVNASSSLFEVNHPFQIWLYEADHAILSQKDYDVLGLPVLCPGVRHGDPCGIPVPELYFYFAVVGSTDSLLGAFTARHGERAVAVQGFAQMMHKTFAFMPTLGNVSWSAKQSKAVYRGSCFPTADSEKHGEYLFLRGDTCLAASLDRDLFDIGTPIVPQFATGAEGYCAGPFFAQLCSRCQPCNESVPLSRDEMAQQYRFQISIDGYGPTFDAMYWKLASNSVVLHIGPQDRNGKSNFFQWFSPLLIPWVNYVPSTAESLVRDVKACLREDERCKSIAQAGRELFLRAMRLQHQQKYIENVLHILHNASGSIDAHT